MAVGGANGDVQLVDLRTGQVTARLDGFERDVQSLCWRRLLSKSPQPIGGAARSDIASWGSSAGVLLPAPDAPPVLDTCMPSADREATVGADAELPPPPPPSHMPPDAADDSLDQSTSNAPLAADGALADRSSAEDAAASEWRDMLLAGSRDAVLRAWVTGCASDAFIS